MSLDCSQNVIGLLKKCHSTAYKMLLKSQNVNELSQNVNELSQNVIEQSQNVNELKQIVITLLTKCNMQN